MGTCLLIILFSTWSEIAILIWTIWIIYKMWLIVSFTIGRAPSFTQIHKHLSHFSNCQLVFRYADYSRCSEVKPKKAYEFLSKLAFEYGTSKSRPDLEHCLLITQYASEFASRMVDISVLISIIREAKKIYIKVTTFSTMCFPPS